MTGLYAAGPGRRRADARVEVRESRKGRALRVDGTFASWYVPGRAHTGSVWDALVAPLCWLPPSRRRAVLVLGLGAGSAARLVRAIAPRARIVGVERSAGVLRAARRHFDLDAVGVEIVHADARDYLARSRAHFDAVIEDLFVGNARSVRKPEWLLASGLVSAARWPASRRASSCASPAGRTASSSAGPRRSTREACAWRSPRAPFWRRRCAG